MIGVPPRKWPELVDYLQTATDDAAPRKPMTFEEWATALTGTLTR